VRPFLFWLQPEQLDHLERRLKRRVLPWAAMFSCMLIAASSLLILRRLPFSITVTF
jgi:hypothetical protein